MGGEVWFVANGGKSSLNATNQSQPKPLFPSKRDWWIVGFDDFLSRYARLSARHVQPPPALFAFHNQIRKMADSFFSASDPAIHPHMIP